MEMLAETEAPNILSYGSMILYQLNCWLSWRGQKESCKSWQNTGGGYFMKALGWVFSSFAMAYQRKMPEGLTAISSEIAKPCKILKYSSFAKQFSSYLVVHNWKSVLQWTSQYFKEQIHIQILYEVAAMIAHKLLKFWIYILMFYIVVLLLVLDPLVYFICSISWEIILQKDLLHYVLAYLWQTALAAVFPWPHWLPLKCSLLLFKRKAISKELLQPFPWGMFQKHSPKGMQLRHTICF